MGYRDAVARGLYWKPFARMIDACIRPASSLADFWSSGSIAAKAGWIPTGNRVESRARDLRSCSCLCKASPSRPGWLLSCLLVDIPQPSMFDRGPHLKRRFKKLAVVLLLAWRDVALTISPVAKLRAQRRAAPRALNRGHSTADDTEFAGKPYPRSFIFSGLFHSFCSYGFFCSLFLWVHIQLPSVFSLQTVRGYAYRYSNTLNDARVRNDARQQ